MGGGFESWLIRHFHSLLRNFWTIHSQTSRWWVSTKNGYDVSKGNNVCFINCILKKPMSQEKG